jgi:uncharacterized membrane protein YhaH (DUF805 family)
MASGQSGAALGIWSAGLEGVGCPPIHGGRMKFWVPWGMAAVVTMVAVYFFFVGLADGSVSSFNAGLWALILLVTIGVTAGSLILKKRGRPGLGSLLALVLAFPGLLAGLFLLLILITQPRWN